MSVRSMTGYARLRQAAGGGEVTVSVKSVNHRGLDVHCHLSHELEPIENALRVRAKAHICRGHLQVHISFRREKGAAAPAVNRGLLEAYINAHRWARDEFGLAGEPDLNSALRIPGVLSEPEEAEMEPGLQESLLAVFEQAVLSLNNFREREGGELACEMLRLNREIQLRVERMQEIRASITTMFHARMEERLFELLKGTQFFEPQRLIQEAAILADRSDVSEELARLRIHSRQVEELLAAGGEVGKKIDFLLQEMSREANTVLSKSTGTGEAGRPITDMALATKADIEKMREQALNLE